MIAALKVYNSAITFASPLGSGETQYPGFNVWGAELGEDGSSPLQPTVTLLAMNIDAPGQPGALERTLLGRILGINGCAACDARRGL